MRRRRGNARIASLLPLTRKYASLAFDKEQPCVSLAHQIRAEL